MNMVRNMWIWIADFQHHRIRPLRIWIDNFQVPGHQKGCIHSQEKKGRILMPLSMKGTTAKIPATVQAINPGFSR